MVYNVPVNIMQSNPRHLNEQEWAGVRLEYETSTERPTLRELADKHHISRSTIFKRAAREKWKQNATVVEAARKQIIKKMEANLEAATTEAAQLVAKRSSKIYSPGFNVKKKSMSNAPSRWEDAESNESKSCGTVTSRTILSLNHSQRRLWIGTTISFGAISD
jgi:hypothetical protein